MATAPDTCQRWRQNSNFRCSHCEHTYSSRKAFSEHLNFVSSGCDSKGIAKHVCSPCNVIFDTVAELIDHLDTDEIHAPSLHNCACQGLSSELRKYLHSLDTLHQRCQSHFSKSSLLDVGWSPLHCATMNGHSMCVMKLLKWGANPNLQDEFGCTPLHLAMARGNIKIIMQLLRHGGNLLQEDLRGKSPLYMGNMATNLKFLMSLLYFEERDGNFVPTRLKAPNVAYILLDHCLKSSGEPLSDNMAEDISSPTSCRTVMESPLAYDRLARAFDLFIDQEETKRAYYDVINHCKERAPHFQLIVLGDVAAGKTSLVGTLSGKEFCPERHATDGIASSFLETVSIDDSWHEVSDRDSMYNIAVTKTFIAKLKLMRVMERLADDEGSHLIDDFERSLSVKDDDGNDGTVATLHRDSETIVEPVKGLIREYLEHPENLRDDRYKVKILDFAGHTLYLPMHHIFLNAKALYLVCFDLKEHKRDPKGNMKRLRFWLNSVVAHRGIEHAIFLVGTRAESVEEDDIKKANEDIKGDLYNGFMNSVIVDGDMFFFPIENSKGPHDARATNLKKLIQVEARALSSESGNEVPIKWLRCEEHIQETVLKDRRRFSLTKRELRQELECLCEEFSDEDFEKMLEMFHHSGIIWLPELLVKKGESFGRLSDFVIINIQHLMDGMTSVFKLAVNDSSKAPRLQRRAAKCLQESAKISHEDLKRALADVPAPADDIIELLNIYHVIVPAERINSSEKVDSMVPFQTSTPKRKTSSDHSAKFYIIPSLLNETNLDDKWTKYRGDATEITFFIDFYNFVNQVLFHQLLVRLAEQSIRDESIYPVIGKFDGIFGWHDELCYRLVYYSDKCVVKGTICKSSQNETGCYNELLISLSDVINGICEDFFTFQKSRLLIPCSNPECVSDATFSFVSQIASELPSMHLVEYNPRCPKRKFCGPHRIDFSDGVYSVLPRPKADASNGSQIELQQSVSVDSGVGEPSSASSMKVDHKMMNHVSGRMKGNWSELARNLAWPNNIDVASLIETIRLHKVEDQTYDMLTEWTRNMGKDATLDLLQTALCTCGRTDVSQELEKFTPL